MEETLDSKLTANILYTWCASIIALAYCLGHFNIDISNTFFVMFFRENIPAIELWGNASFESKHIMIVTLSYMLSTAPIALWVLFLKVKTFQYKNRFFALLMMGSILFFVCRMIFFGKIFNAQVFFSNQEQLTNKAYFYLVLPEGIGFFCAASGFAIVIGVFSIFKMLTPKFYSSENI